MQLLCMISCPFSTMTLMGPNEAHLADHYSPARAILKSNYVLKIMLLLLYAATYGITLSQDFTCFSAQLTNSIQNSCLLKLLYRVPV